MMKTIQYIGLVSFLVANLAFGQKSSISTISQHTLYDAGVTAVNKGNIADAQKYFTAAKNARHPLAAHQLSQLVVNRSSILAKKRELTLKTIQIDQIDFTDAAFVDAISHLGKKITEANKDYVPNFVVRDPDGILSKKTATLQLNNIPASVILEQLLSSASAKVTFSEHTITIAPR